MTPVPRVTDCASDEEQQEILLDSNEADQSNNGALSRQSCLPRAVALSLFSLAIIATLGRYQSHGFISKKSAGKAVSLATIAEESPTFSRSAQYSNNFRELAMASGLEVLMVNDESIRTGDRLSFGSYGVFITQQSDGNLVIYKDGYPLWASGTVLERGNYFTRLQQDGNLVTRNEAEEAVWSTNSHTDVEDDCFLAINLDDAKLEIIRGNEFSPGDMLWSSVTLPELIPPANNNPPLEELNKFLTDEHVLMETNMILNVDDVVEYEGGFLMQSPNGALVLMEYQSTGDPSSSGRTKVDGALALIGSQYDENPSSSFQTNEIWSSGFVGDEDSYWTILQGDGNLVTHTSSGVPVWASNSVKSNGYFGDFHFILYPDRLAIVHGSPTNPDDLVWERSVEKSTVEPIASPMPSPSPAPQENGLIVLLLTDETIDTTKTITFDGGFLIQEFNGNLALYKQNNVIWTSSINSEEGDFTTKLQGDGNLVTTNAAGAVVWASYSHSDYHGDYFLAINLDLDELEIIRGTPGNAFAKVWSSTDTFSAPPYNNPVTNADFSMTNSDHTVGVYYYPWYGNTDFNGRNYARAEIYPPQLPSLGEYDQRDPEIIKEHLRMSRMANVNLWVTSWWGPGSATDRNTKMILDNRDLPGMKIALFYETRGRVNSDGDVSKVFGDLAYAAEEYFGSEHYLKINGRPVFFVYLARWLSQIGRLEAAVSEMRKGAMSKGYEIYIVGDSAFYKPPTESYQAFDLLDAVTNYDVYGSLGRPGYAGQRLIDQERDRQEGWRQAAHAQGCDFIPAAEPGYNDNGVRNAGHQPMSRKLCESCGFGSLFRELVQNAVNQVDFETGSMLMVTSFNEWHEDTQIEPVTGSGTTVEPRSISKGIELQAYGNQYLEILRDETARDSTTITG